jgi:hypothetical protein
MHNDTGKGKVQLAKVHLAKSTYAVSKFLPWKLFSSWVTSHQLYTADDLYSDEMLQILHYLSTSKIEQVLVGYRGSQLKATFIVAGGQKVLFKPMRQGCSSTHCTVLIVINL